VAAGSFLVFAHGTDPGANGGLPAPTATFPFSLGNTMGSLYIGVGPDLIDEVTWDGSTAGAARNLDPAQLDPVDNNDATAWCPATASYGAGDKGSPGAANETCPIVVPPGQCLDGSTLRDLVPPALGDLVISEIMANPTGDDTMREWFEITMLHDADLAGLALGTTPGTVQATLGGNDCRHRTAGTALVLAHSTDPGVNGGLGAVEGTFAFSMGNTSGALFVASGTTVLDQVAWSSSVDGAARSLDPGQLDPTANDTAANWCTATASYGAGGAGSPGQANPACLAANQCLDGGVPRAIVPPGAGDLVISEVLAGQADPATEWFEVTVLNDVDLNGLQLGPTSGSSATTIADVNCRHRTAGTQLVFARGAPAGLPTPEAAFSFTTGTSGAIWIGVPGTPIDGVMWSATTEGVSRNLDPDSLTASANDQDASWCPSTQSWTGGLGSPGAANEQCPAVTPMCLDADGTTMRPIVAPEVGDLLITEVLNNPSGTETHKEWFEVLVNKDVDLVGLSVCSPAATCANSTAFSTTDCQRVTAGTFLVFANGTLAQTGLTQIDYTFTFTLVNSVSTVAVLIGGQLLDSAAWTSSTMDGTSRTLEHSKFDTVGNDTGSNFCNSTNVYNGTDKGTPGADDPSCN
jgi:hypothetical protein